MFKTVNFLSGLYLIDKFAHCSGVSTSIAIKKKKFTVFVKTPTAQKLINGTRQGVNEAREI